MTTTTLYQYETKTGEFLHPRPAQTRPNGEPILDVLGATPKVPPSDIPAKHAAHWTGDAWEVIEDHRQKMDKQGQTIEGTGTKYWLPLEGDDWRSEGRYQKELGPLPEGAQLTRPEKTQAEINADRVNEIKSELAALDAKAARPLRAVSAGMSSADDIAALKELETRAQALRDELAALPAAAKEGPNVR